MLNEYICNACNYITNIKCNFMKHIYTSKHLSKVLKYNCSLCHKNFSNKQKLNRHLKRKYPCDVSKHLYNDSMVTINDSITILYKYLNYIDRIFCFNFEYNSNYIDNHDAIQLIIQNINLLKSRFTGYELFTNSIAISFFNFSDRQKYMFFNSYGSKVLLVKCNIGFRKFEIMSPIIIKYIIDLIIVYDNTLENIPELTIEISDNIISNLIIGYNRIKKSYTNILLDS